MRVFDDGYGEMTVLWSVAGLLMATFVAVYFDQPMSMIG